jgi:outer membrane protein insertion porin family
MGRALGALVALASLGCATAVATPPRAAPSACSAGVEPIGGVSDEIGSEPEWGTKLTHVVIERGRLPRDVVGRAILLRAGSTLEAEAVKGDVARLLGLEAVANVRVELEGTRLRYLIEERPAIRSVIVTGRPLRAGHWLPLVTGELYDPARVRRMQVDLEADLVAQGHLDAKVEIRSRKRDDGVDVCVLVRRGKNWSIDDVRTDGNRAVSERELLALLDTHQGRVNTRGKPFHGSLLDADLPRLLSLYYDRGFIEADVGEPQVTREPKTARIRVRIPITEGARHRIGAIRFVNVPASATERHARTLGVASGEVFSRSRVAEGLERLRSTTGTDFDLTTEVHSETLRVDLQLARRESP